VTDDEDDDDDDKEYTTGPKAQIPTPWSLANFPHNRSAKLYNEDKHL